MADFTLRHEHALALDLVGAEAHQRPAVRTIDGRCPGDPDPQVGIVVVERGLLKRNQSAARGLRAADCQIPFGSREIVVRGV